MFEDVLAELSSADATAMRRVIDQVHQLAPDATEGRSYGLAAFLYRDRPLLGFAARRKHLSLYPFSPEALDTVKDDLAGFEVSKGTLRFTSEQPVPTAVIEKLVRARMAEIEGPR